MELVINIIYSVVILCIILIWFVATYNKLHEYKIRINEAETNIDSTLRKRFDLVNKSIGIIKANTDKTEVLEEIASIRSKKVTNFELDRKIYDAIGEIASLKETYKELKKSESFMKVELDLNETEAEMVASRKYYNDTITDYNKMVKSFPSNIVAKLCKFKYKLYFDGKSDNKKEIKI